MKTDYTEEYSVQERCFTFAVKYRKRCADRYRNVVKCWNLQSNGIYLMTIRPAERNLDKFRFANFSHEALHHSVSIQVPRGRDYSASPGFTNLMAYLRYETERWSFEIPRGSLPDVEVRYGALPLTVSFQNPKEALILRLFLDEILRGEKPVKRRSRKVAAPKS